MKSLNILMGQLDMKDISRQTAPSMMTLDHHSLSMKIITNAYPVGLLAELSIF